VFFFSLCVARTRSAPGLPKIHEARWISFLGPLKSADLAVILMDRSSPPLLSNRLRIHPGRDHGGTRPPVQKKVRVSSPLHCRVADRHFCTRILISRSSWRDLTKSRRGVVTSYQLCSAAGIFFVRSFNVDDDGNRFAAHSRIRRAVNGTLKKNRRRAYRRSSTDRHICTREK